MRPTLASLYEENAAPGTERKTGAPHPPFIRKVGGVLRHTGAQSSAEITVTVGGAEVTWVLVWVAAAIGAAIAPCPVCPVSGYS